MEWWRDPLRDLVAGRRVILAGGVAAAWTPLVASLRELRATDILVAALDKAGAGAQPDCTVVVDESPDDPDDPMASLRTGVRKIADPPARVIDAVEAFDPEREAVVFAIFLGESPTFVGRDVVAHRRPEWVALEDKTRLADVLDRAGVTGAPSVVVPLDSAADARRELDVGAGTAWSADASGGYHGGGALTRWVTDDARAAEVTAELRGRCHTVRVMPFLDGIATSIHGLVLPDGVAVLRPVELVTLRRGLELRYSGCGTFWDPPDPLREEMRDAARRVGETLRDLVGFRGAFTLDGVASRDGFRPTELNPRFGAGLSVITRGLAGVPLPLVLDLVVAGRSLGISAADLEAEILRLADATRTGGTWQLHVPTSERVDGRAACFDGTEWRWADGGEEADGFVVAAQGFARLELLSGRTPVGPSIGPRSAAFWRFADTAMGTAIGPLTAPPDVTARF
jgi:hypothetical protein